MNQSRHNLDVGEFYMLSAIDALPSYFRLHESEAMDLSTCKTVQLMAAAHGQSNDPFGVVLDLSNLPAYRIDELKFWLKFFFFLTALLAFYSVTKVRNEKFNTVGMAKRE